MTLTQFKSTIIRRTDDELIIILNGYESWLRYRNEYSPHNEARMSILRQELFKRYPNIDMNRLKVYLALKK